MEGATEAASNRTVGDSTHEQSSIGSANGLSGSRADPTAGRKTARMAISVIRRPGRTIHHLEVTKGPPGRKTEAASFMLQALACA